MHKDIIRLISSFDSSGHIFRLYFVQKKAQEKQKEKRASCLNKSEQILNTRREEKLAKETSLKGMNCYIRKHLEK